MQTVRRLYLYVMSGITLGVVLFGLNNLFVVVFHAFGLGRADLGGSASDRETLSLSIALIVVGGLVWGIHWLLIERSLRADDARASEERTSPIRALYLSVVLAVTLAFGVLAAIQLLQRAARAALQVPRANDFAFFEIDLGAALATVGVMAIAWGYHVIVRRRDLAHAEMSGAAAWLPRVYLYGAALLGLILAAIEIGSLLRMAFAALIGQGPETDPFDPGSPARATADALAGMVAWTVIWAGHWLYATNLSAGDGWRALSERRSRLRVAFLVAVIGAGAIATVALATQSATTLIEQLLGQRDAADSLALPVAVPLLALLPWLGAWWIHAAWLRHEAQTSDVPDRPASAARLSSSIVALVGAVTTAAGGAGLLGLLLDRVLGGTRTQGSQGADLPAFVALALIGTVLWLGPWMGLQARHAADPVGEAASTVRRSYLLIVIGASLLAVLASLAVVLFQVFNTVLGVQAVGSRTSIVAAALGVLLMAAASAIYHGLLERADRRLRTSATEADQPTVTDSESLQAAPGVSRALVLHAPTAVELEQGVATVRAALPPGVTLEEEA